MQGHVEYEHLPKRKCLFSFIVDAQEASRYIESGYFEEGKNMDKHK